MKDHFAKEVEKLQSVITGGKPRQNVSCRPSVYIISGRKEDSEQTNSSDGSKNHTMKRQLPRFKAMIQ